MDERFGRYIWHDDKNQYSVEKHGISFQRAAITMEEGRPVDGNPRNDGRHDAFVHLNDETIKVVYQKAGDDIRIISAHKNSDEKFDKEYEERAEKLGIEKNTEFNEEFAAWKNLDKIQNREAGPDVTALKEKQKAEENAVLAVECSQAEKDQLTTELKAKHRQEKIEDRKPRLEHDSKERSELAAELQKQKEQTQTVGTEPAPATHQTSPEPKPTLEQAIPTQGDTPVPPQPAVTETPLAKTPEPDRGPSKSSGSLLEQMQGNIRAQKECTGQVQQSPASAKEESTTTPSQSSGAVTLEQMQAAARELTERPPPTPDRGRDDR